ncbi:MAG TPA: SpoIIE family protein phosphatase, partial [Limnochordia bacterium]
LPPSLLGQLRRWVAARGGEAPRPRRSEPGRWPGLSLPSAEGAQGAIEERLRALSELFTEMAGAFESGTESAEQGHNESARIVDRVGEALCRRCGGFRRCWQEHYYDSYSGLIAFTSDAQSGEKHNLPPGLAQRCFQPHKLIRVASDAARQVRTEALLARRLSEVRCIVPAQLRGMAEVVTEIAGHFQLEPSGEPGIEEGLLRALGRRCGVAAVRVMPLGRGKYEIVCHMKKRCPTPGACGTQLAPQVTALLGVPYEVFRTSCLDAATRAAPEPPPYRRRHAPSAERKGGAARRGSPRHPPCRVVLRPRTAYEVRCQAAGVPKDPGGISGDASACFDLRDGRSVLLLSDGMGQGAPAALESQAAVALLRRLLEVGFEAAFAISVVNSILLVRATTEQFATIDVVVIDRYSGESTFYKIGSPPSFIRRGSHVDILRARSLPAGILTRIEVAAERRYLRHDDLIVLMTDGALERIARATDGGGTTSEGRIAAWLRSREDPDPAVLAGELLGDPATPGDDDRTVVIAQLVSREHVGSLSRAPEIPEYRRAVGSRGRGGDA